VPVITGLPAAVGAGRAFPKVVVDLFDGGAYNEIPA
jgi:hypothetical protein